MLEIGGGVLPLGDYSAETSQFIASFSSGAWKAVDAFMKDQYETGIVEFILPREAPVSVLNDLLTASNFMPELESVQVAQDAAVALDLCRLQANIKGRPVETREMTFASRLEESDVSMSEGKRES